MKAVILAAGESTRMRPLTETRPKAMLPLLNKPILEYTLLAGKEAGIKEFIFVIGYHGEKIQQYFGNGDKWKVNIEYCHQTQRLGTANAIVTAGLFLDHDNFIVLNGDVIIDANVFKKLIKGNDVILGIKRVADTTGLGVLQLSGNRITHIFEKTNNPPSNVINAGVYYFNPDILEVIKETPLSARGEYEITDSLQMWIDQGHPVFYEELNNWIDLSYPWDLLTANENLIKNINSVNQGIIEENVIIKGNVSIGEGTVIKSGTYIVGPVIIGQNCDIGPNAYIRAGTTIADSCHVGAACEVKNSIIMRASKVPHLSYVGDSIIGESCNLGAGTKIANLRLDHKNVIVGNTNTKRRKFGAMIGDNVQTGINVSINTGTSIASGSFIPPGMTVSGVIVPGWRRAKKEMSSQSA